MIPFTIEANEFFTINIILLLLGALADLKKPNTNNEIIQTARTMLMNPNKQMKINITKVQSCGKQK